MYFGVMESKNNKIDSKEVVVSESRVVSSNSGDSATYLIPHSYLLSILTKLENRLIVGFLCVSFLLMCDAKERRFANEG